MVHYISYSLVHNMYKYKLVNCLVLSYYPFLCMIGPCNVCSTPCILWKQFWFHIDIYSYLSANVKKYFIIYLVGLMSIMMSNLMTIGFLYLLLGLRYFVILNLVALLFVEMIWCLSSGCICFGVLLYLSLICYLVVLVRVLSSG